jgi:serine phosphatase RsbU (regulator of sigma subunit)/pSer/pThr/pTyr-binding forkhead associated (FHA) protein
VTAQWRLEVEQARAPKVVREIDRDSVVVGRGAESDLQISDLRVSRQHCRFDTSGEELWIEDLGSRRGTRLNGALLDGRRRLNDGDLVELSEESRITARRGSARSTATQSDPLSATIFRDADKVLARHSDFRASSSAEELRRYVERLHLLNEVHHALAESPSRDVLLEMILDRVFRQLRPEQAAVLLLGSDGDLAHAVTRPAGLQSGELFFSRSLIREVTSRRLAALVLDAERDERFAGAASILMAGVRSVVAAPLLTPDGALGVIVLSSRARIRQFGEEDLELLVSLASVAALHLRNLALAIESAERRRLEEELALARRIQLALLPATLPAVSGYELVAGNIPSRHVSGDLYAASIHPESGRVMIFVADVSGKGMAASLLGASLEALTAGPIEVGYAPADLCTRVSRRLFARTPPEKYATAFVARLDPASHLVEWTNAGHNPALKISADGTCERLGTGGPPLGILPAAVFRQSELKLEPGDLLVIYTDGLSEAVNPGDEEFGIERLEAVTRDCRERPLGALREAIEEALDDFAAGVPFADDRTLLLLRRVAPD